MNGKKLMGNTIENYSGISKNKLIHTYSYEILCQINNLKFILNKIKHYNMKIIIDEFETLWNDYLKNDLNKINLNIKNEKENEEFISLKYCLETLLNIINALKNWK